MHLHLPKPLHGWRAFIGEVGIIVLGVLVALGFEQLVSRLNAAAEERAARQAIRGELELDMARLRDRQSQRLCTQQRLAQLQALLDEALQKGGFTTPGWVGRPQAWTMERARWDANSQAGHAALLPPGELALYASMYALMDAINATTTEEAADWVQLRSLEHLHSLNPEMHFELTRALGDARYLNWRINSWIPELESYSERLNLKKARNGVPGTNSICVPLDTPQAQALRLSQSPGLRSLGEP